MVDWDGFEGSASRLDDDMEFRYVEMQNEVAGEWDPEEGEIVGGGEYETVASGNWECRVPTMPRTVTDASGTDSEADLQIFVAAEDLGDGVEVVDAGSESESSRFVLPDGREYQAMESFDEGNGLVRVNAVER